MLLLIKLIELTILFAVIRIFIKMMLSGKKQKNTGSKESTQKKRFDSNGADVSDGEYKEID